jgi:hypothetical protein
MRGVFRLCVAILATSGCNDAKAPSSCVAALPGWATPETGKPVHLIANEVTLKGHDIRWNGVAIDEQTLADYARQSAALNPVPFLIFDPGTASDCSFARHVRDTLDHEYPCRDEACWQGSKAALDKAAFKTPKGEALP